MMQQHYFVNIPGDILCGECHGISADTVHKFQSTQVISYRKPIAVRFDLIPPLALRRLAAIYEEGAQVYGTSKYVTSPMPHSNVVNHLINHLNLLQTGDKTEDHAAKIAWAACTLMVYEELGIGEADLTNYGVKVNVT